ncbi:NADP-dependent oxidoreductase domain-containing protein [Talaromyces proteolyticus]|uniref:D-xylose reductase [NAD(P)H] n=1 Tax=Talaromyces proteolyticus TaxID=1131652 RepID=A0AAD4L3G5_9EURO|nr:NADP-dependent oxidoreductase domain-containing protein [Talaromyces proteolyticus]KAH8705232.1 NADP-dependent oxidoreductase domain-containing protein [Talaromyces proteolyticus]
MATLQLNDGTLIPTLAFGAGTALYKCGLLDSFDRNTVELIKSAIAAGYRHLDTAEIYGTEVEVGLAIRESLEEGVIQSREELFVTTKISGDFFNSAQYIDVSLPKLGLEYVDLYLIHSLLWANSTIKESRTAKSIGVSGFDPSHLKAISVTARMPPSINQLEYHPYFSKRQGKPYLPALRSSDTGNVAVAAYGALVPLTRNIRGPLDETLIIIAKKHGITPELRIEEYLRVFDFKLTADDIGKINETGYACISTQEPISRARRYFDSLQTK